MTRSPGEYHLLVGDPTLAVVGLPHIGLAAYREHATDGGQPGFHEPRKVGPERQVPLVEEHIDAVPDQPVGQGENPALMGLIVM